LETEEYEWSPTVVFAGRQAAFERIRPYRASIPLEIAERSVALSADVLALAAEATAEISRFDGELGRDLAPFGSVLLRSEAAASSQIEQLTASAKAVLMAEAGDVSRVNATVIAANTDALSAAIDLADRLDEEAIIEMQRTLLASSNPGIVGTFRSEQVWIGGRGTSPHTASFVPPHHDRVPAAMADLVRFFRRADVPPFVQAMVGHAQFETVHPFPDGNGRTGRALIHAVLRHTGVTRHVTVPVSAGLLTNTAAYFDSLTAYREGDVDRIVREAADAAFVAVHNGRLLADDVRNIETQWDEQLAGTRSDSVVWKIIVDLPRHPVIDAASVVDRFGVSAPTASDAIGRLVDRGVLVRANGGQRFRKWIALDIAGALDRFAERSGRPS
jgi:Fic family protein